MTGDFSAHVNSAKAEFHHWKKDQLEQRLEMRGLKKTGRSEDLAARLAAYEATFRHLESSLKDAARAGATMHGELDPALRSSVVHCMIAASKRDRAIFVSGALVLILI